MTLAGGQLVSSAKHLHTQSTLCSEVSCEKCNSPASTTIYNLGLSPADLFLVPDFNVTVKGC
jgi:hypothetical protein